MTKFIAKILEFDGSAANIEGTWIKTTKKAGEFIGRRVGQDAYIDINQYNQIGFTDDPAKHPGTQRFGEIQPVYDTYQKDLAGPARPSTGGELTPKDKLILWQNQMNRAVEILELSGEQETLNREVIMKVVLLTTMELMDYTMEYISTGRIKGVRD